MSIPPPGHETPQASQPFPPPAPQADDTVQYEFKSVQAVRGREGRAQAKWQTQGWELVSENRGKLRTELMFRRAKPKTAGAYLLSAVAAFRRLQPKTRLALVAGSLILVVGIIGAAGGETPEPSAARTTASTAPPAEPTVTSTTVDERLDDAEPVETAVPIETAKPSETAEPTDTSELSERRAKARARARAKAQARARAEARSRARAKARARARVKRRAQAARQERRDNTLRLQSGATCAEIGRTDIPVEPGASIDRDGDGIGCES